MRLVESLGAPRPFLSCSAAKYKADTARAPWTNTTPISPKEKIQPTTGGTDLELIPLKPSPMPSKLSKTTSRPELSTATKGELELRAQMDKFETEERVRRKQRTERRAGGYIPRGKMEIMDSIMDQMETEADEAEASMSPTQRLALAAERREASDKFLRYGAYFEINSDIKGAAVGPEWNKEITTVLHTVLIENTPTSSRSQDDELTLWEGVMVEVEEALIKRDSAYFMQLAKSLAALNRAYPVKGSGESIAYDRFREVDGEFIREHLKEKGKGPEQQKVRENRKRYWKYLGLPKPEVGDIEEKPKPLPTDGCYKFMARTPGRPRKAEKTPRK